MAFRLTLRFGCSLGAKENLMRRLWLVVLVAASLVAVSCGSGSDDDGGEQVTPTDIDNTLMVPDGDPIVVTR